jgi:hypothetical protein
MSVLSPSLRLVTPGEPNLFHVEVTAEYVLITLRDLPLTEEGPYRFSVAIDEHDPVTLQVPVVLVRRHDSAAFH